MKAFICGNKENAKQYRRAEAALRKKGYVPINPVKVMYGLPKEINNSDFTVIEIELVRISDVVYLLPDWDKDLTERIVLAQAKKMEKEIIEF